MSYGYCGKVLRVNLSERAVKVEEPGEVFYRRYLGGRGLISYYLLKELKPHTDPLGPGNKLIFAAGPVTGAPVGGCGRNSVGAKSPLTGAYGDAEAGGYFGAELKRAGYDAIIIEGKAEHPVFLWIKDDLVEIRDARHLWGKATAESQELLRQELGEPHLRTTQIGPAGENLVRFACIMNDISHAAGRTGMGAVMGSKNLKAIAVRGQRPPQMANPSLVASLARWLRDNVPTLSRSYHDLGTAGILTSLDRGGGLPTRNFRQGNFEKAAEISGRKMKETILVGRGSCFACPVQCKRAVALQEPYQVDPIYGGPEYETLAALGSNCGIGDLPALAKAAERCNAYGLDTISTGATIAFAMECFERGIISGQDTQGVELSFGNAGAMLQMVEDIAHRRGFGALLAEGVARAARRLGRGAEEFALHVKGQEVPMHEPRFKQGMGLGYALSPTGADHSHNMHDSLYYREGSPLEEVKAFGILEPVPIRDLGPAKVRLLAYYSNWQHLLNCLVFCNFVPLNPNQIVELVRGVTGWNTSLWELMKAGERCHTMARLFNVREGFSSRDDALPGRFFTPFSSGPLQGVAIEREKLEEARLNYYRLMGWGEDGVPSPAKLCELDIPWAGEFLNKEAL